MPSTREGINTTQTPNSAQLDIFHRQQDINTTSSENRVYRTALLVPHKHVRHESCVRDARSLHLPSDWVPVSVVDLPLRVFSCQGEDSGTMMMARGMWMDREVGEHHMELEVQ
jgi:hypothetical protein